MNVLLPPAGLRKRQLHHFCSVGTCLGLLGQNPHICSHSSHTKRDESHPKQTLLCALLWQRIYHNSNRKQLCNFSFKTVLPVTLRNIIGTQAEDREQTVSWSNTSIALILVFSILDNRYRKKTPSHLAVHPCYMPYRVGVIYKAKKDLKEFDN